MSDSPKEALWQKVVVIHDGNPPSPPPSLPDCEYLQSPISPLVPTHQHALRKHNVTIYAFELLHYVYNVVDLDQWC